MRNFIKKISLVLLVIFLVFTFVNVVVFAEEKVIKTGVFEPLTGTMAIGGTHQKDGVQFSVDKINEAGGLLDSKLVPIHEDTESNMQNTVNIMNKFFYKNEVLATIGSNNSPRVLPGLDMITEAETSHIVPSGVAGAITQAGCEWIFRITVADVVFSKRLIDFVVNELKAKKIATIHDTNDYGQGGVAMVTENLQAAGLKAFVVEGYTDNRIFTNGGKL